MWIAFDMDGTIFDCGGIIVDAYRRAIPLFTEETGIPLRIPSKEELLSVMGNTADGFFSGLFPDFDRSYIPALDRVCTAELVSDIRGGGGALYHGVRAAFESLNVQGHRLLIASNGQHDYITAILESNGLDRYLAAPVQTVDYRDIVTKGDILSWYRRNLHIEDPFVMVGDRRSDLVAAAEAGAVFIGCAFGHAGNEEIKGADFTAADYQDVLSHIRSIASFLD